MNVPTFKELLTQINSGLDEGRPNCSLGFFINEYYDEASGALEPVVEINNLFVKKPIVQISRMMESDEIYYNVSFHFKSFNDVDYKQLWNFLCQLTEKSRAEERRLVAGENLNKVTALSVSILPEKYNGKYFAYVKLPLVETISRTEDAYDRSAVISFICSEDSFGALASDDDMIDRRSIESEAEQELVQTEGANGAL